jgi:hypothetical protein
MIWTRDISTGPKIRPQRQNLRKKGKKERKKEKEKKEKKGKKERE